MANIRHLDLNLLLVLDALFQERSVTAVARQMGISQPTVSQSLRKLRDFFADDLFVRGRGGLDPTAFAATLRGPIHDMLTILEHDIVPPTRFDPATSRRTFTLCMSDTGELCFLPRLVRAMAQRAPHMSVRTMTLSPLALKEAFASGTVDMALGNFPDLDAKATRAEHLTTDSLVCIARRGHPVARDDLSLGEYLSLDHAMVAARSRFHRLLESTLEKLGLEIRIRLRLEHFVSVLFIVESSDLVATVPLAVARAFSRLANIQTMALPLEIPPILIAQHWHDRREADPGIVWLRALNRELFAGSNLSAVEGGLDPATAASGHA